MTFKLIGITGPAQSGKDTAADYIISKRPVYQKASFADPMKAMLGAGFALTNAQLYGSDKESVDENLGCTPRHMLQTLGTEWGRQLIHRDVWVIAMQNHLERIGGGTFIIPDVRFENEAKLVRAYGRIVHVQTDSNRIVKSDHVSEDGVIPQLHDIMILNNKDLDYYHFHVFESLKIIENNW